MGGYGLNLSRGSNPYTPIPDNTLNVDSITFCGVVYNIHRFFSTQGGFVLWLNNVFVPINNLQGAFYINQYEELLYTNEDDFCDGSISLDNLEDTVLTMELSTANETIPVFQPIMKEVGTIYFIPENA
jgi:hypothetical protein